MFSAKIPMYNLTSKSFIFVRIIVTITNKNDITSHDLRIRFFDFLLKRFFKENQGSFRFSSEKILLFTLKSQKPFVFGVIKGL